MINTEVVNLKVHCYYTDWNKSKAVAKRRKLKSPHYLCRYRDYSNAKFGDISAYFTPVNYSTPRLSRGLSVQDVSTLGDHGTTRRLTRQSSLDQHRDPHRHSNLPSGHYENAYQDLLKSRRTPGRSGKEEKKRRPINCNKVRSLFLDKLYGSLFVESGCWLSKSLPISIVNF